MMPMLDPRALLGVPQQAFLGDHNLGASMGGPMAQVQVPQAHRTAPAAQQPAHKGPGFLNVLDALFNDGGVGDALAKVKARKQAQAEHQQLMDAIAQLPEDQRAIALAEPEKYFAALPQRRAQDAYVATLPPDQQAEAKLDPAGFAKGAREAGVPQFLNTAAGVVGVKKNDPTNPIIVTKASRPTPAGWEWDADGHLQPIAGGPADPSYISQAAGVRRDAVVSRPTPGRAKVSARAAVRAPPLPPGFQMEK